MLDNQMNIKYGYIIYIVNEPKPRLHNIVHNMLLFPPELIALYTYASRIMIRVYKGHSNPQLSIDRTKGTYHNVG